jgi:hypothetical protein
MATWLKPDKKSGLMDESLTDFGGGVNNGITPPYLIADNESPKMSNIAPWYLPSISPIYPPVILGAPFYYPVLMMGAYGSVPLCVSGRFLYKFNGTNWVEVGSGGMTGTFFSSCNFMGNFLFTSVADGLYLYDGTTVALVSSLGPHPSVPMGAFVTSCGNRVFLTGESSYPTRLTTCAWRNIEDWSSTGATGIFQGYIESPSGEPISAIATLTTGQVVVFKWTSYHEMWIGNDDPSTWQVVDRYYGIGCAANNTLVELQGYLYWLALDGVYRWNGASPERISDQIRNYLPTLQMGETYNSYCAGADNRFYYIHLDAGMFAYDTYTSTWWGPWNFYSSGTAQAMLRLIGPNSGMYVGDDTARIYRIDNQTNTSSMTWYYETKPFADGSLAEEKQMVDAYITAEVWPGASLQVYLSNRERDLNDGNDWTLIGTASAQTLPQTVKMFASPLVLEPSYFYRLKFTGTGRADISGIDKSVYVTPK